MEDDASQSDWLIKRGFRAIAEIQRLLDEPWPADLRASIEAVVDSHGSPRLEIELFEITILEGGAHCKVSVRDGENEGLYEAEGPRVKETSPPPDPPSQP